MTSSEVVQEFLLRQAGGDWESCRDLLDEGIVRVGSEGDTCEGRASYLERLVQMHSEISDYHYQVQRMTEGVGGDVVLLEISEQARNAEGEEIRLREAMVFDLSTEGRITKLRVYAAAD